MMQSLTDFVENIKTGEEVIIGLFLFVLIIRLFYDLFFTGKVAFYNIRKTQKTGSHEPISLIFTVRNEELRIKENLPRILSQITGHGEIVVVDDFSQDQTFTNLGIIRDEFPNLKISSLNQETRYSVKVSQNVALKAASSEWIIVLSPLVSELPKNWMNLFQDYLTESKNVVLGYSNVYPGKGLYHHLYRIESFFQQMKSFSYLLNGFGFVVKEENIAFRKSNYFNAGGYGKKINEAYANLELILNEFIKKKFSVLLLDQDAQIRRSEKITLGDYRDLLEKFRRIRSYLPFIKRAAIYFDDFFRILWPVIAILTLTYFGTIRLNIAGLIALKILIHALIIKTAQKKLNERKIFLS